MLDGKAFLYGNLAKRKMIDAHGMKVVVNKILPPKGFKIIVFGKWMFVKPSTFLVQRDYNHEATHLAQQKELLFVFFYLMYVLEWLVRLLITFNAKKSYRTISFEQEAYENDTYKNWVHERPHYYWLKYWRKR